MTPTLVTACTSLPPEGAELAWGRPYAALGDPHAHHYVYFAAPRVGLRCLGRPRAALGDPHAFHFV